MRQRKISATLGPTNTGKTYSAIKKLLQYSNGVIGFPLRLLARENFEATKKEIGEEKVALVTGEEKVIPEKAKYFFCTVESIPDQKFDFVAIDEVQLCADYERGHLFSEKVFSRIFKEPIITPPPLLDKNKLLLIFWRLRRATVNDLYSFGVCGELIQKSLMFPRRHHSF